MVYADHTTLHQRVEGVFALGVCHSSLRRQDELTTFGFGYVGLNTLTAPGSHRPFLPQSLLPHGGTKKGGGINPLMSYHQIFF